MPSFSAESCLNDAESLVADKLQEITELRAEVEQRAEDLDFQERHLMEREQALAEREERIAGSNGCLRSLLSQELTEEEQVEPLLDALLQICATGVSEGFSEGEARQWFQGTLAEMRRTLLRLRSLIHLDHLQKGKIKLAEEPVELAQLLEQFSRMVEEVFSRRIQLTTCARTGMPEHLLCDPRLLEQIIFLVLLDLLRGSRETLFHLTLEQDRLEVPDKGYFQAIFTLTDFEGPQEIRASNSGSRPSLPTPKDAKRKPQERRFPLALADRLSALAGGYLWQETCGSKGRQVSITLPLGEQADEATEDPELPLSPEES